MNQETETTKKVATQPKTAVYPSFCDIISLEDLFLDESGTITSKSEAMGNEKVSEKSGDSKKIEEVSLKNPTLLYSFEKVKQQELVGLENGEVTEKATVTDKNIGTVFELFEGKNLNNPPALENLETVVLDIPENMDTFPMTISVLTSMKAGRCVVYILAYLFLGCLIYILAYLNQHQI